jgi:hypothetical protein
VFSEFFRARGELMVWPLIGLFVFLGAFLVVLFRVFFRSKGESLDRIASLPLQGDDAPAGETRSEGGRS